MTQARGMNTHFCLDFEDTFGAAPAVKAGKLLPFNSLEIGGTRNLITPATITGTRNPVEPASGNIDCKGSLVGPLDYNAIGWILTWLFGNPTTTGTTDYTHTWKVGSSAPSAQVEKAIKDLTNKFFLSSGVKISTLKIPFGGDGEATYQADLIGANEAEPGATQYDAAATAVTLNRASNFHAAIKEGGSAIAYIKSGDFTIATNLDANQYTVGGNGGRGGLPEGILGVNGTLKALLQDTTLIEKGANETISSLEVIWTKAANISLGFEFPEIRYSRVSPKVTGPAGLEIDLDWQAFYKSDADASAVIVTLKNQTASYAS